MDKAEHSPRDEHEREIWTYLKAHPEVSRGDILAACGVSEHRVDKYLRHLKRMGMLTWVRRDGRTTFWTAFDTTDIQARAAEKRGCKEASIWKAMRIFRAFTVEDLLAALMGDASITRDDIRAYAQMLARSKYLSVLQRGRGGNSPVRWRLVKDTGPLPPVRRRMTVVIDANEDRIVYARGERI